MDIGTKKLTLIEKILKIENESVLSAVEKLLVTPRKPITAKNSKFSKFSGSKLAIKNKLTAYLPSP